jgi:hypothetical protein
MKKTILSIIASVLSLSAIAESQSVDLPASACYSINYYRSVPVEQTRLFFSSWSTAPHASFTIHSSAFLDVKTIVSYRTNGVTATTTNTFLYNPFGFGPSGVVVDLPNNVMCKKPMNNGYGRIYLSTPGATNFFEMGWIFIQGH